ncbi:MAG: Rpn family recombination-promoting nuclease/putative transposase, partial [Fibromonadales bacterium]|nr:Rpn family recombination-promoting nuclease/putative transposase [Fibromonadales bacterium]
DVQFDFSSLVFVRLSEFKKSLRECESFKDKLLFSIRHAHELDEQPPQLEGEVLDKIFQAAKIANFTSEEYADYMNGVRGDWDHWAEMDYAKEIGFTAGREEGIAVGRDEGIAVGETKVLDLMAQGYGYEQIKELLSK